ncbi:MAG TPA: MSMEG_0568 family radical SAM protein [Chthoniobacteraceae bacterium]|jgi:radical SAM protein (TIGR04043 family)|nr:MSMEG_0568 family radical SAM protein [Chthoniobacteraceae bacterium]
MPPDFHSALLTKKQYLLSELQTHGLRLLDENAGAASRRGGAGPTDHKAVTVLGVTIMAPVHTRGAHASAYLASAPDARGISALTRDGEMICEISFPPQPRFYAMETRDGVPYWKIAQLHSRDTLATTVLQTCIRYGNPDTKCQFCAIGESLKAGRTIARKTAAQLGEVAEAAQRLDGIRNVVMTTGTPPTPDRGASVLAECAAEIKRRTGLPIQGQCEPPADFAAFRQMHDAGIDSLGMHLEAWDEQVRARIMPGKAEVTRAFYLEAFAAAVEVFGRGQVSTYLLAGLGDTAGSLHEAARVLIGLGVYPFIVPFVPVTGTPLAGRRPPDADFMRAVLAPVGAWLADAGMTSDTVKAGCVKCAACTTLSTFENKATGETYSNAGNLLYS